MIADTDRTNSQGENRIRNEFAKVARERGCGDDASMG